MARAPRSCPRCGGRLLTQRYRGVSGELCAGCRGILVRGRELTPLLSAIQADYLSVPVTDLEIEPVADRRPAVCCPDCAGPMETHGYLESDRVQIDSCSRCDRVWLDAGEIRPMALLHAKGGAPVDVADAERTVAEFQRRRRRFFAEARRGAALLAVGALGVLASGPLGSLLGVPGAVVRGVAAVVVLAGLLVLTHRAHGLYRCPACNEIQIRPWFPGSTGLRGIWGLRLDPEACLRCGVRLRQSGLPSQARENEPEPMETPGD